MPSQKTQKAARRRAQADVYANPPGGVVGSVPGGVQGGPIDNSIGTQKVVWGKVEAYAVDANRLKFDMNVSAMSQPQFSVATDAPHFEAALSMAKIAYQNQAEEVRLTVRYLHPDRRFPTGDPVVHPALEVAFGNDPAEAITLED